MGSRTSTVSRKNITVINFARSHAQSQVSIDFRAPSWKLKILAIPDVFAYRKSYEHDFTKKCNGHKLCAKSCVESSFDGFFVHHPKNLKYWPFPTY
ncbi:hypothetical protein BHE74_00059414 [Ensete ventricosum]|nr:hypothetical protein BHE74_00059414 [Ensete ventricosum]